MRDFDSVIDGPDSPFEIAPDWGSDSCATAPPEEAPEALDVTVVAAPDWEGPYPTDDPATAVASDAPAPADRSDTPSVTEEAEQFEPPTGVTLHVPSERTGRFDQLVAETRELVAGLDELAFHPEILPVVRQLGSAVDNLIMANVRDGVAEIPDSRMQEDGFAAVPLLPEETTIVIGNSMLRPTPHRVERLAAFAGITEEEIIEADLAATPDTARRLIDMTEPYASTYTWQYWIRLRLPRPDGETAEGGTKIRSRPIIILTPKAKPLIAEHELVHAIDAEQTWPRVGTTAEQRQRSAVRDELRAFHVESGSDEFKVANSVWNYAEGLRRRYNTDANPFATPPGLVRAFIRAKLVRSIDNLGVTKV